MSNVKLNSSGGGSVTVSAPVTASNYTVTLPAATSTLIDTTSTQTLTNKTLTAAGVNTVEATSGPTSTQLAGQRNKIINGAMMIDQRNAGASVTNTAGNQYSLDRWQLLTSVSSKFTVQQNAGSVIPPVGFTNYIGVTSSSAYSISASDYFLLGQPVEGFNISDLALGSANAKTITLSFQVYSSLTGTFGGSIQNNGSARSYPFSYTISSANTWTQITVPVPGDTTGTWLTNNGVGLYVWFGLGVGSTISGTAGAWVAGGKYSTTGATSVVGTNGATFYITGVQLEKGATATPFENRLYGTELALCQRYFESSWSIGTTPGSVNANSDYAVYGGGGGANTTSLIGQAKASYKVTKRAVPTVTLYDNANPPNSGKCLRYTLGSVSSNNENVVLAESHYGGFNVYSGNGASAMGVLVNWKAEAEL